MNYENKHRIESLAKAACPNNKKVSVIFRSKASNEGLGDPGALLAVNSMRTSNILDIITAELD